MPLTDEQKVNREATQKRIAEALENLMPLQAAPYVATIPTGQWSGSGNDYYITVTAANVTANSILIPQYDKASASLLRGAVWCVPGTGSFTIHTSAIPAGTVSIMVMFAGTMGEAQYQVLADVYSKSQTDELIAQSAANFSIIKTVEHTIPNDTNAHEYDLPTGMNTAVFIGAMCYTKYSTWVDALYGQGSYFGEIGFMASNGKFMYTAKNAGNATKVLFAFLKVS